MTENLNAILIRKFKIRDNSWVFSKFRGNRFSKISNLKFSFVHLDFDLYQPTIDCFNFIKDRLEKCNNFSR